MVTAGRVSPPLDGLAEIAGDRHLKLEERGNCRTGTERNSPMSALVSLLEDLTWEGRVESRRHCAEQLPA